MRLQEKYTKEIIPAMKAKFGYANVSSVPKIEKVVLNIGVGKMPKENNRLENIVRDLSAIAGQQVVATKAKKSIAGFKLREGSIVGYMVTLRKSKMYEFLERLINIALPRTRDFRGLNPNSFDEKGNLSFGIKEHSVFSEIGEEDVRNIFPFEITVTTTAKNKEEGRELLKLMGFPIKTN